jgi:hypothetical protein
MLTISRHDPWLQHIPLSALVTYLDAQGWQRGTQSTPGMQGFLGPPGVHGHPVSVVVPTEEEAPDKHLYLLSACAMLCAVTGQSYPALVAQLLAQHPLLTGATAPDGCLYRIRGEYIVWHRGETGVTLDGVFSVEDLRLLATWLEIHQGESPC